MMRALLFGANGQDGYYLSKLLIDKGLSVIGVSRTNPKWILGDVSNYNFVENLIKDYKPQYIFHLAANSTTKFEVLFENHETISTGTMNILNASYRYSKDSRIFISGSGLQFKNIGIPIDEKQEFDPNSPYSVSRIHSVYTARYFRSLGLKVFVGYFFNHDSPLRSERHVNQKIVQALRRIADGSKERLKLGDITVKKEFGFSGDIVKAIWLLINNDKFFEATIGTGRVYSIQDWLDICSKHFALDWTQITEFEKASDVYQYPLLSDPKTIMALGWSYQVGIHKLADLMINLNDQ